MKQNMANFLYKGAFIQLLFRLLITYPNSGPEHWTEQSNGVPYLMFLVFNFVVIGNCSLLIITNERYFLLNKVFTFLTNFYRKAFFGSWYDFCLAMLKRDYFSPVCGIICFILKLLKHLSVSRQNFVYFIINSVKRRVR